MFTFFRSGLGKTLLIVMCAAAGCLLSRPDPAPLNRLEMAVYDYYSLAAALPPSREKVAVVLATEESMREFGRWPWPRGVHAGVVGRLGLAKRVMMDLLFSEESDPDEDNLLAAVVKEAGNVTQGIHFAPDDSEDGTRLPLPYPALAEAAVDFGVVNIDPQPDGVYREGQLFWVKGDVLIPSLAAAAWLATLDDFPDLEWLGDAYRVVSPHSEFTVGPDLRFMVAHPSAEVSIYEYANVYYGRVSPEAFRDALVFVGVNSVGAMDFLPVGRGEIVPGTLYNAHAALTLINGWIVHAAPAWLLGLAAGAFAALGAAVGLKQRVRRGWLWMALAIALWFGLTFALFLGEGLWLPPVRPVLIGLATNFLCTGIHLRYMSDEWKAQALSADALLFLGGERFDPEKTTLADYLAAYWGEVEKWSGVSLEAPAAPADDPRIREFFETPKPNGSRGDTDGLIIVAESRTRSGGKLLLRLPGWEDDVQMYAVLAWRGKKSREILKSTSALVFSAAANYKGAEESHAKKELFLGVIRLIMGAVDAKDPTTAGHSERVAGMARELAEWLGMSRKEVEEVYLSGLLHDVGKIGIPDSVLSKPGRLDDDEMEIMRRHPSLGAELMRRIKLPDAVLAGILEHHERPDGNGYPNHVYGKRLNRVGAILKVADVFDALLSKRQYKDAMPMEKVLEKITEGSGSEFDPEIVAVFLKGRLGLTESKNPDMS